MIDFDLSTPVLLPEQWEEAAEKLGEDPERMKRWMLCSESIATEDGETQKDGASYRKFDTVPFTEVQAGKAKTGADAVLWYCKEKRVPIEPITRIYIPLEVFDRCHRGWSDICAFAAKVERISNGIRDLEKIGAPPILLADRKRQLYKAVYFLQYNGIRELGKDSYFRSDGLPCYSLRHAGYSLIDGFKKWETEEEKEIRLSFEKDAENEKEA